MTRIVDGMLVGGHGADAVIATKAPPRAQPWPDTPPAPTELEQHQRAREQAVRRLLRGYYLYGCEDLVRGWEGCIFDALKALRPEAADHLREHQDARLTYKLFANDPEAI